MTAPLAPRVRIGLAIGFAGLRDHEARNWRWAMPERRMDRATVEGIELEYGAAGTGDPVVPIHPGHVADWLTPLPDQPVLADRDRVIHYHRVGSVGSTPRRLRPRHFAEPHRLIDPPSATAW